MRFRRRQTEEVDRNVYSRVFDCEIATKQRFCGTSGAVHTMAELPVRIGSQTVTVRYWAETADPDVAHGMLGALVIGVCREFVWDDPRMADMVDENSWRVGL